MTWLSSAGDALGRAGWSWPGAVLGAAVALGLLLAVLGLPASRRHGLTERLEPYLRDTPRPSRLLFRAEGVSMAGVTRIFRPLLVDLARGGREAARWVELGASPSAAGRAAP